MMVTSEKHKNFHELGIGISIEAHKKKEKQCMYEM